MPQARGVYQAVSQHDTMSKDEGIRFLPGAAASPPCPRRISPSFRGRRQDLALLHRRGTGVGRPLLHRRGM